MISITPIGSKEEPYPMLANIWDFFSEKGTKTVFVSVGTGTTCLPELDLAETIGCCLLKLDTPRNSKQWEEVKEILKTRKTTETTSDFAKSATRKWVLPKNVHIDSYLPSYYNGTIVVDGEEIQTKKWFDIAKDHCAALKIPEEEVRLDCVKVDSCPQESLVLESLLQSGLRPSLLLVNWFQTPDTSFESLLSAAHLQMAGYALIGKEGNRFLYYFTDVNYYELCSWETVAKKLENPLISQLAKSIYPGSEGVGIQFPKDK